MQTKQAPKPLAPDRMRALFAAAAVRAKDTKVVVCMVRTTLQNRTKFDGPCRTCPFRRHCGGA